LVDLKTCQEKFNDAGVKHFGQLLGLALLRIKCAHIVSTPNQISAFTQASAQVWGMTFGVCVFILSTRNRAPELLGLVECLNWEKSKSDALV